MKKSKTIAIVLAIFLALNGLGTFVSSADVEIPAMPQGNANLYNPDAGFLCSSVNSSSSLVSFSHSSGVLSSSSAAAENACAIFTKISGLTQMTNPDDNTKVNIDTLTMVTKSTLTITSGADAGWKGGSIVLRYDSATKQRLTLRYSPAYNSTQGCLRLVGYNGSSIDYPLSQAISNNSGTVVLAVVQSKNSISVFADNSFVFTYTVPSNSPYLSLPYSFGLTSVNSVCNLSSTSMYFTQRMDSVALPPMPQGNSTLYDSYADFVNSNINQGTGNAPYFFHSMGIVSNTRKDFINLCVVNTRITGQTQMLTPSTGAGININQLTSVTKTHLTMNDIGTDSWNGAGVVLRYNSSTKDFLYFRESLIK